MLLGIEWSFLEAREPNEDQCYRGKRKRWTSALVIPDMTRRRLAGAPAARFDDFLRLGTVAEAAGLRPLRVLEVLVDLEEVLDLIAELRRDVVDIGDRAPRR